MTTPTPPTTKTAARPTAVRARLVEIVDRWSASQHDLVVTAAELADSGEWVLDGSATTTTELELRCAPCHQQQPTT